MRVNYGQPNPMRNAGFPGEQEMAPAAARGGMFGRPRNNRGQMIAGVLGDALARLSGGQALYLPNLLQQRQQQQQMDMEERRRSEEAARPQRMTVGGNVIEINPATGRTRTLFTAPTPERTPTEFERVLQASGLQPGTPEYQDLARQYAESRANPMQYLPNGDGTFTAVPRGGTVPQRAPQGRPPIGTRVDRLPSAPTNAASGVPGILERAARTGQMSQAEYNEAAQMLGPNGRQAMDGWLQTNRITLGGGR